MSTLDIAGNSNWEMPTHLWKLTEANPTFPNEHPSDYVKRLAAMDQLGLKTQDEVLNLPNERFRVIPLWKKKIANLIFGKFGE